MLKLDIGCGDFKAPGFIGVDTRQYSYVDVVADARALPFKDNLFDYVRCYHLLEHFDDPIPAIEEAHRVLKVGGVYEVQSPHFTGRNLYTDITHKTGFSSESFLPFYCMREGLTRYSDRYFSLVKVKIGYHNLERFAEENKLYKYLAYPFIKVIDFIANMNIILAERVWAYWVGGFDHITFWLKKI